MRQLILAVALAGFAAVPTSSDEGVAIRYSDPTSRLALEIEQDISVREHESIAARTLYFEFDVTQDAAAAVGVTIEKAGGTYTAHGMEQRLRAPHLTGQGFTLSVDDQSRRFVPGESPLLFVGPPVSRGVHVAEALAETLPVLPTEPVAEGSTWRTERPIHSLEGWSWGTGVLSSTHRVSSVERRGGRRVVSVDSHARAALEPIEEPGFTGTLERTYSWTFDATSGRLLSLSMTQESNGISPLQQGDVEVNQVTTVELGPVARG